MQRNKEPGTSGLAVASEGEVHCVKCGAVLTSGPVGLSGHCPDCLLQLAMSPLSRFTKKDDFGEYRLVRQLGRGATGVVYEAIQLSVNRPVALKMLLDANFGGPAARRRFVIEAEATAKLAHPNIVPVYDFGEWEEQPFLSMRLIQGQSLKDKLAKGELRLNNGAADAKLIAEFMACTARAVAHAHEQGVLHRDLKPGNILVESQNQPHLTDFGLAKLMREQDGAQHPATVSGAVIGTPSYMAPEQAVGGRSSVASDVYSLGAVFYEMLTGQPPFKAPTALETLRLVTESEAKKPREINKAIPRDLETICLKCLEKKPALRYASAEDLAADLELWLHGRPIAARPASIPVRLVRWCRRNPVGTALVLVLCAALGVTLALLRTKAAGAELLKAKERQERIAQQLGQALAGTYTGEVERMWTDPGRDSVIFDNLVLAAWADRVASVNPLQLVYGMEIDGDPVSRAAAWAPVLWATGEKMQRELYRPVAFSLRLQKHRPDVAAPSVAGQVDFQRIGPLAYIRAKEIAPDLQILVGETNSAAQGVIFAREGLGVTNLAGIRGLPVAFAHSNSIVSFAAKVEMAREGITCRDLKLYKHLDPPRVSFAQAGQEGDGASLPGEGQSIEEDETSYAHKVVIEAVLKGEFAVGECRLYHFQRNQHRGLIELKRFNVPGRVYISSARVDRDVAEAFRNALCSLKKPGEIEMVRKLFSGSFEGFIPTKDQDLDYIRAALTNEIRCFETPSKEN